MSRSEIPCLSICVVRLRTSTSAEHFAIWVLKAPYPGGYVHHDCIWSTDLTQTWQAWQQLFSLQPFVTLPTPLAPLETGVRLGKTFAEGGATGQGGGGDGKMIHVSSSGASQPQLKPVLTQNVLTSQATSAPSSYSARLMQQLGLSLWQWVFDGQIQSGFAQSIGMAIGQDQPLRLRLEIRDPDLIALPWEIMQPRAGKPAISLNQQVRFSRTTSDVDQLAERCTAQSLNILLVLGEDAVEETGANFHPLQLEQEATALAKLLEDCTETGTELPKQAPVPCSVDTLVQPTPAQLISRLETGSYNVMLYAGHGVPAPDGGQLRLRPGTTLSGTELAQVLVSGKVTLAVFNACWGAQPDRHNEFTVPRSSLAEVLIHHGVPAVLAMRDEITDDEALSFIQAFVQALAERMSIDQAVAIARQQLLTLYKFNQPAWTLPVLYMHPEFDGELIQPLDSSLLTELPENAPTGLKTRLPVASLRPVGTTRRFTIRDGLMRVGRRSENDLVIQERWVSQKHAEIFCRHTPSAGDQSLTYFLRDFSRYGTLVLLGDGWQKVHHQEVPLQSGIQLKFGSSQGQTLEFVLEA